MFHLAAAKGIVESIQKDLGRFLDSGEPSGSTEEANVLTAMGLGFLAAIAHGVIAIGESLHDAEDPAPALSLVEDEAPAEAA